MKFGLRQKYCNQVAWVSIHSHFQIPEKSVPVNCPDASDTQVTFPSDYVASMQRIEEQEVLDRKD